MRKGEKKEEGRGQSRRRQEYKRPLERPKGQRSKRETSQKTFIMGKHALDELINHEKERIVKVFLKRGSVMISLLEEKQIPYSCVTEDALFRFVGSSSHQGIVVEIKKRKMKPLKELLGETKAPSTLLMLDSIFDPQNFGALLRAAECFGVDGVIFSKNRGASLTPVVSKASAGASEHIPLVEVSNLSWAVKECKEAGYQTVAAELKKGAVKYNEASFDQKVLLILGSEGKGIQPLLSKMADLSIYIPMKGKIESLNVSQAGSVFLFYIQESFKLFGT